MVKLIKSEADYQQALARIDRLMEAESGTPEGDELEVLAALVEMYESRHYPIDPPDPIEAIKFRMDQAGLTQKDLLPYIGSKSKVSEVLSGKRTLTLSMMRALNTHLGIPAEILLKATGAEFPEPLPSLEWTKFPLKEMAKRGWIDRDSDLEARAEELMRGLIARAGGLVAVPKPLFRKKDCARQNAKMDRYALMAWCLRVLELTGQDRPVGTYTVGVITREWLRRVARLSYFHDGPQMAREYLSKSGIHLVVVPHLPKTYLDGAVMLLPDGRPVVGLTLRYDRIDHFWFCPLHELAHIGRHFRTKVPSFFVDDLSLRKADVGAEDRAEKEADEWAEEALIPREVWKRHPARLQGDAQAIIALARELEIHPAIIAGRIRYEQNNYRLLSQFVGQGEVRKHFEEYRNDNWGP